MTMEDEFIHVVDISAAATDKADVRMEKTYFSIREQILANASAAHCMMHRSKNRWGVQAGYVKPDFELLVVGEGTNIHAEIVYEGSVRCESSGPGTYARNYGKFVFMKGDQADDVYGALETLLRVTMLVLNEAGKDGFMYDPGTAWYDAGPGGYYKAVPELSRDPDWV